MGGYTRLNVKGLGLAMGVLWAVAVFLTGLVAAHSNWGHSFVAVMSSLYIGYKPTVVGSLIGAAWGFVDWFIAGCVLGWLYNCFSGCCNRSCNSGGGMSSNV
ncbi:MAG TPA: bacteriophage holin [Coxiellaceae bacterium]|nr:bacteriophage holin [Coxiellaceae bacterium]